MEQSIPLKAVHFLRKLYWWLARPTTKGVRAVLTNEKGEVLLVKHKYTDGWYLPGGKVKKKESDIDALHRELGEEVGTTNLEVLEKLGEYVNHQEYKKDTISVFVARHLDKLTPKKHFEIGEMGFFDVEKLPEKTSPGTKRRIEEFLNKKPKQEIW